MNKKIKVAWIAPYPVSLLEPQLRLARPAGGFHPCSWIVTLARALAARDDVELHLITQSHLVPRDQVVTAQGIVFHVLKWGVPFTSRGFPSFLPVDVLTAFAADRWRIRREIRRIQPDLVHGHGTESTHALAAIGSELPCLISIQGIITEYFKTNPTFRFRLVRHYECRAVRRANYFTCRTDFDTQFVRSVNPQALIFHIHEAMHPVYFQNHWQPREEDTIVYVGSLEDRKGLPTLLEAMRRIVQQRPAATLTVIGGGPVALYQKRCAELDISRSVTFAGFQSPAAIARFHTASQVFVLPSENENSPNALAEAMISGMPVIATRVGGIPSLLEHGQSGLLIEPRSPEQLAEAVIHLLESPELRQRLGARAQTVARDRHQPEKVAAETLQAYRRILAETGR
jgi:glycosyltransferase involved in cell wall biosynthesis